ncbi:MAG: PEGA domain-containing protein [Bryobacteraceae bacterium]|jgi:hypothetical protein
MRKGLFALAVALMTLAPISASAYWGPIGRPYYGGYYAYPITGQVKLDTKVKNAEVFINGAFAGMTQQTKSMHLRPGSYNIEIRELGQTKFTEQVYVVAGRTLHLRPQL